MNRSLATPAGISALVALVMTVLLTVFAWPGARTAPRHLPLGLVAPPPIAAALPQRLQQVRPGAFAWITYADEAAARRAIRARKVYGALVLRPGTPPSPVLFTASAASPAVAQLLGTLEAPLAAAGLGTPTVEDMVPATASDPRQAALLGSALPLVLAGVLSAFLLTGHVQGAAPRLLGVALVAVLGGASLAAVMQFGYGTLTGSYAQAALVATLAVGAVAALATGLGAALGRAGLAMAGAVLMLLSNPFSALGSAPELLPAGWGTLGQWLPIGAFGTLMRSVTFFDGAGSTSALWVLVGWLALGTALIFLGSRATVRRAHTEGALRAA